MLGWVELGMAGEVVGCCAADDAAAWEELMWLGF